MKHQPWRYSTGPRTAQGKARSAANAHRQQMDEGYAELQRIQREVLATIDDAQKIRARIAASSPGGFDPSVSGTAMVDK